MGAWDRITEEIATGSPVAVYLSQPGCGPCRALRPRVRQVLGEGSGWSPHEVDIAADAEARGQLLVFTVPTLILFVDGREVWRGSRVIRQAELERQARWAEAD